jgi:hypothetical protein
MNQEASHRSLGHNACLLTSWNVGLIALSIVLFICLQARIAAGAAAYWEPGMPGEPIPKNFKSWSLFLTCNYQWLLTENQEKLADVYRHFRKFGDSIGSQHLALWLWKRRPNPAKITADDIDVDRNAAFCTKLKVPPSKSPYIVVMTSYPDLNATELKYEVLIEVSNLSLEDIDRLISILTDQLSANKLWQEAFNSEQYWGIWRKSIEFVRDSLGSLVKAYKVTISTGILKVELEGGAGMQK